MFDDARLKINRAEKHIADLEAVILDLHDAYTCTIEKDPQRGAQSLHYQIPNAATALNDIALISGDAVHNLKTALDYAWVGALASFSAKATRYSKFPVFDSPEALAHALRGAKVHINAPRLFEWITETKPHLGGNYHIKLLHELDIADKHKLLLPVGSVTGIEDTAVECNNETITGDTWLIPDWTSFYVPFSIDCQIKKQGKPALAILFKQGCAAESLDVPETLRDFSRLVLNLVQGLGRVHP